MKLGIGFSCSNNDGGHALPHVIYRFMKEKYIDEFLISGKLRLPTMDAVRRIDSDRRDSREGWLCNVFHHPDGYAIPLTSVPQEGCDYVLCAARSLMARNPCSHKKCLRIFDIEGFATAVSMALRKAGLENICRKGICIYNNRRNDYQIPRPHASMESRVKNLDAVLGIARGDALFCKERHFWCEREYRMVWSLKEGVSDNGFPLYVVVNNPQKYADKCDALYCPRWVRKTVVFFLRKCGLSY